MSPLQSFARLIVRAALKACWPPAAAFRCDERAGRLTCGIHGRTPNGWSSRRRQRHGCFLVEQRTSARRRAHRCRSSRALMRRLPSACVTPGGVSGRERALEIPVGGARAIRAPRSTTSRAATLCTRPADTPVRCGGRHVRHRSPRADRARIPPGPRPAHVEVASCRSLGQSPRW